MSSSIKVSNTSRQLVPFFFFSPLLKLPSSLSLCLHWLCSTKNAFNTMAKLTRTTLALLALASHGFGQTFQRLGTCPKLGCVLPPDQSDFLPGQLFDLRVEVHAPINGSEAFNNGVPDENFTVTIGKVGEEPKSITDFFTVEDPEMEKWEFGWYEDRFAEDAGSKSMVNVASKIYRHISITEPGEYEVTLTYYNGETTVANWVVRPISAKRKAKNVIFFIGDGMTTNMVSWREGFWTKETHNANSVDHGRPSAGAQVNQRQVPVAHGHGHVPCFGPPDDALHRLVHYGFGQLCRCSLQWPQGHCERHGVSNTNQIIEA